MSKDTIELAGRTFHVDIIPDDHMGEPWKESDGHGIVSDWTTRGKLPGERVLCRDRSIYQYYDVAETTKLARKDGWGIDDNVLSELTARAGRKPTRGEVIAEAVRRDFEHLRRWCAGHWYWVGITVTLLDDDDDDDMEETTYEESLWGIQSDDHKHLDEVAKELAEGILSAVNRETTERDHWAARDTVTI